MRLPVDLSGPVQTIVLGKAGQTVGSFDTEIVSMSLSGELAIPSLPVPVQLTIQESPTLNSIGHISITDLGTEFQIDSFFEVFTELSVDGGLNFIPSDGITFVELAPPPAQARVQLTGTTTVNVTFEGTQEGDAVDDDGDTLDDVQTEIVDLSLQGNFSGLPIEVRLNPNFPSLGTIEEQFNETTGVLDVSPFTSTDNLAALSEFQVFPEIDFGFQALNTIDPIPLSALIGNKPPNNAERYVNPFPVRVQLHDVATGIPQNLFLVQEIHDPDPTIEHDIFPRTIGQVVIDIPGVGTQLITTAGPSQVDVYFEGPAEGDAWDDDGDGLDEVTSQLVQANFDGFHPLLGPVQIRLRDDTPSLGVITEQVNNTPGVLDIDPFAPGNADSFFDVFFEITLPATGQTLVTAEPTRLQSVIDDKPPEDGERYMFTPPQPVELIDAVTGLGTGIFIVREIHDESPTVEHDIFPRHGGAVADSASRWQSGIGHRHGPLRCRCLF